MSTVLLVDDYAVLRGVLRDVLTAHGHHVIEAEEAAEALSRWPGCRAEVVVTDVEMPGLSGFELCRRIRDTVPNPPPVILMSGCATRETELQAAAVGAAALLPKPFSAARLLREIERVTPSALAA